MKRLLAASVNSPRLTLAVMLAITVALGAFAPHIRVSNSVEALLPSDDPGLDYYREIEKDFGRDEFIVVALFADDVFALPTLAKVDELSKRLADLDGVREVVSITTARGAHMTDFGLSIGPLMEKLPQNPEEAAALRDNIRANPLYGKSLVSEDGRATGISVLFDAMTDEEFLDKGIEEQIRALVKEYEGPEEMAMTGVPTIKVNGARKLQEDRRTFTPLSVGLIIIVLFLSFRTIRGVAVPMVPVAVGAVWTTGLMVIAGESIGIGTVILTPLLLAVGVAYSIHVVSRYYDEVRPDRTPREVVTATLDHVWVPTGIAALTTVLGFGTLGFSSIPATRSLGIYASFGISAIFLASITAVPALLVLLPLPKTSGEAERPKPGRVTELVAQLGAQLIRRRGLILAVSLTAVLVSAWGATRIQVETDFLTFFSPQSVIRQDYDRIADTLAGTQPLFVVVQGKEAQAMSRFETLQAMHDLQVFMEKHPKVDQTISLVDYLFVVRKALDPEITSRAPQSQQEVAQVLLLIDPTELRPVVTPNFVRANIVVRTRLSASGELRSFVESVEKFAADRFIGSVSVKPTGGVVLLNRSADTLARGQVISLLQIVAVLLVILSILFLSIRVGLLSLVPNVVPIAMLFGIMGWFGVSLNVSTSMIAAIAIGIAVDDTIHFLNCFNGALRDTGNQEEAVVSTMRVVGQPIVFTSIALAVGFLILPLSNFQPIKDFGFLSATVMMLALFGDLFVLPAVITVTKIITLWDLMFLKLGPEPERQIPVFAGLRPLQAKIVVLMGRLESAEAGAFITRFGEVKPELYVLLSGHADVRREGGPVIRTLGRGDVVGEMGLVRESPRTADVIASEHLEYLALDRRFLARLRWRYPRIAATVFLNLTRILSDRLESTTDSLVGSWREASPAGKSG
jgi:predicted RND superfamily exporter protein